MGEDLAAGIGVYVELARVTHGWQGCCPFHEEQTPSFVVIPARGIWHCFGCGRQGHTLDDFRAALWGTIDGDTALDVR